VTQSEVPSWLIVDGRASRLPSQDCWVAARRRARLNPACIGLEGGAPQAPRTQRPAPRGALRAPVRRRKLPRGHRQQRG